MHLTATGTKHMTVVVRAAFAMSCHCSSSNTNLSSADGHGTSSGTICARDWFAISVKSICAHRAHSTTAIDIVHHMTTVYLHRRITTHDAGIEVEISLTICSCIGIRTTARTIYITTVREAGT